MAGVCGSRGRSADSALNLITRVRDGCLNGREGCGSGKACPNHFDLEVDNGISAKTRPIFALNWYRWYSLGRLCDTSAFNLSGPLDSLDIRIAVPTFSYRPVGRSSSGRGR